MPILDDWGDDDEDEGHWIERCISRITECSGGENDLNPPAPKGWWAVVRYATHTPPVIPLDAAAWMLCVATVHIWERENGRTPRTHQISRESDGSRVLIVHPRLRTALHQCVETINAHMNGDGSNCGGWTTLEPVLQARAARVFARRACANLSLTRLAQILDYQDIDRDLLRWGDLSEGRRAELVRQHTWLSPELVLEPDCHWIELLPPDSDLLYCLATEAADTGISLASIMSETGT